MTWGFLWLMLALKLPLAALIYIVWWAIKAEPEPPETTRRGRRDQAPSASPAQAVPRRPRRGPHGDPAPRSPARVRTVPARARTLGH